MHSIVSIIIPTYNRKELLAEAVQSCFDQTWRDLEIIIVDDGSADGTDAFVRERLGDTWTDGRVRYYKQKNAGAAAARNYGLKLAASNYVQFLDSDDILLSDKIACQIRELEGERGMESEGCSCYGRMGLRGSPSATQRIGVHCDTPSAYISQLCSRVVHGMSTPAPLWRRSFLQSRPGWRTDISLGDDLEYYIRLLRDAKSLQFVHRELFFVREHLGPRLSDAAQHCERTLSAIRARVAIFESLQYSDYWDVQTQENFLGAMRTLYANVLHCGTADDIRELETWILKRARHPARRLLLPALICLRRIFGRQALLGGHRFVMRLRG